jgi:hypothetical protein
MIAAKCIYLLYSQGSNALISKYGQELGSVQLGQWIADQVRNDKLLPYFFTFLPLK